jgi:sortase (surface protein transpeptidase)
MIHRMQARFARLNRERPAAALLVAVVSLIFAVAGTSVASVATISALTKKEKKQVKKIAKKQAKTYFNANIKGASVARADTATSAQTAVNAEALSGNTVVGEGDLDGPGLVTNSSCTPVSEPVPGAKAGDHVVLTPPSGWPTYEINLTARVTADTVTYEICNQSGVMQNFGTSPPLRFLVFR